MADQDLILMLVSLDDFVVDKLINCLLNDSNLLCSTKTNVVRS